MGLRSQVEKLKKLMQAKGLTQELMSPVLIGSGAYCHFWNHHETEPYLEAFFSKTGHPRHHKGMPVLLTKHCPYSSAPITEFKIGVSKCLRREECEWFYTNRDRMGKTIELELPEDIMDNVSIC